MKTKEIKLLKNLDGNKKEDVITTSANYAEWLIKNNYAVAIGKKTNKIIKP